MDRAGIVRAVFEQGWNERRFDALAPALGTFELHVGGQHRTTDLAELEVIVGAWHEAFADLRFDVHAVTASDDVAAVHATLHGTHRGPWQGLAPTGRSIEVEHMFFFRFDGPRITHVWELLDRPALDAQLGR
ncbi:ester cyclase [Isoptericola sp. 178]|uniref:ester cyclase n=1 Tax=Isoptericola sp. 178 TaxID=3064651 RepID=UPI00271332E7|nr:ester cyclase [Isoptericola sp. 178]MDO8143339.1 ester cyclase [Isoptericola sp. 178]